MSQLPCVCICSDCSLQNWSALRNFPSRTSLEAFAPGVRLKLLQSSFLVVPESNILQSPSSSSLVQGFPLFSGNVLFFFFGSQPSSSRHSRARACSFVSPGPTLPPTNSHSRPRALCSGRWHIMNFPPSHMRAATTSVMRFASIRWLCRAVEPVPDLLDAALQVVSYLIHPEPLYIPAELEQALPIVLLLRVEDLRIQPVRQVPQSPPGFLLLPQNDTSDVVRKVLRPYSSGSQVRPEACPVG